MKKTSLLTILLALMFLVSSGQLAFAADKNVGRKAKGISLLTLEDHFAFLPKKFFVASTNFNQIPLVGSVANGRSSTNPVPNWRSIVGKSRIYGCPPNEGHDWTVYGWDIIDHKIEILNSIPPNSGHEWTVYGSRQGNYKDFTAYVLSPQAGSTTTGVGSAHTAGVRTGWHWRASATITGWGWRR